MTGSFDRVRQMFADQFEPDAQGFLFRKYMKGAPIPVSTAERDRYIATFNRFTRYASWGIAGGTIFLIATIALYATIAGVALPDMALYLGLGASFVAYMAGYFWIWNLPMRELRDRGAIGEARSRAEIKQLFLEKTTYGQIAASAGVGIVLLIRSQSNGGLLSGWNLLWAGSGAALLVLCAIQAFRKWRFETQRR